MKDNDLSNSGELAQGDEFPAVQQCGKGTKGIMEYLLVNLPFDSSASGDMVVALSDEEKNAFARCIHFFLQARYEEASAEAERCMGSLHPEIRTFALMAHILNNVALNNLEVVRKDFQAFQEKVEHSENKRIAALNDIFRYVLSAFFHLGEKAAPIPPDNLAYCSEEARFYVLYAQSYALYLQQEYAQALGVAETALMMDAERHPIICLYLNVMASMAAMSLSRFEQADRFFLDALKLAKPEGYIQPFVGHHGPLQGLVEKHIRDREPELYKMIAEKVMHFRRGWTEIHNPQSHDKVTNLLTPYEFALAMMAAKGKSNQEIADYLHISINTVKAHLSTIFQKLGITKRSELKKYLVK
jgi:DNA-binding CsgD family transcriptional regulator